MVALFSFILMLAIMKGMDVKKLPALNASLNALSSIFLIAAFFRIRRKDIRNHRKLMITALTTSSMFMVSYLFYHGLNPDPSKYTGEYTGFYFFILLTHIPLAAVIVPLAFFTLVRGWKNQVNKHRKIARITLPLWLYVSVTGVIIYTMLYL